jgi:hypothetical protein
LEEREMNLKQASLAIMLVASCALGCTRSNSPTASGDFQLAINVTLANTAKAATIQQAQLLVDGATVVISSPTAPAASVVLNVTGTATPGPHTLAILIVAQTSTPTSYTVTTPTIQVFDLNAKLLKTITLPTTTATLATGGTISYSFSL